MKNVLRAIARALASIPRFAWTVCKYTGAMVLSLIPQPAAPMTTEAGAEADEGIQAAQAKQEKPAAAPKAAAKTQAEVAYTYALAMVTGCRPPSLDGQPAAFVRWLEDLTHAGAKALIKSPIPAIEQHLSPRCPGDHLAGVPSIGARPAAAAPVGEGSHRAVLEAAYAKVTPVTMNAEGDFVIVHDDQSMRLRAA